MHLSVLLQSSHPLEKGLIGILLPQQSPTVNLLRSGRVLVLLLMKM